MAMRGTDTQTRPGLRRVVDALRGLASELRAEKRQAPSAVNVDWLDSFIDSQSKVIDHYRHVLATHRMPPAERNAVLERIARIEAELATFKQMHESDLSYQNAA